MDAAVALPVPFVAAEVHRSLVRSLRLSLGLLQLGLVLHVQSHLPSLLSHLGERFRYRLRKPFQWP